jgi:hypothetical protein
VRVGVQRRKGAALAEPRGEAEPLGVQGGARRTRSPPCPVKDWVCVESPLSCPHVIASPAQRLGQHGYGRARALFFLQAREVCLGGWMVPEKQDRGCRAGPFELGVAALGP